MKPALSIWIVEGLGRSVGAGMDAGRGDKESSEVLFFVLMSVCVCLTAAWYTAGLGGF